MLSEMLELLPVTAARDAAGHLSLAGRRLSALAAEWGTPLYVYDGATVRAQAAALRDALRGYAAASELAYAAKAYFAPAWARKLAALGLGVDVVSLGEIHTAQAAGFDPARIHLHGNNKSAAELEAALAAGFQSIVVDSLDELAFLEGIAARAGRAARIWLRITPGLTVDTHAYRQTGHHATKFGLPISDGQAAEAIRRAQGSAWLKLVGLHTHLGSQLFAAAPYREAIYLLYELARAADFVPQEFSPGGGWGVRYTPDDPRAAASEWVAAVAEAVQVECAQSQWPLPTLVLEPGRWLAARAGVALYTVGACKHSGDGTRWAAVDGGMADNPRPALYGARYVALLPERLDEPPVERVNIVGKFCESGDFLLKEARLPALRRGDLLAVPVAGAYQLSMASNYNLAARPAALWLEADGVDVLQARESV